MKTTPWYRARLRSTDRSAVVPSSFSGEDEADRLAEPQFAVAVARWIA